MVSEYSVVVGATYASSHGIDLFGSRFEQFIPDHAPRNRQNFGTKMESNFPPSSSSDKPPSTVCVGRPAAKFSARNAHRG
uniref:Uncharacterized protein n=1 Tax=Romanomermis culicivorax TaxID=13658 RepID=A0A915I4G3_ROMCU